MTSEQNSTSFTARLDAIAAATDALLAQLFGDQPGEGEIARPHRLLEAIRYCSLAGGKRLRPFLVVESAGLFGVDADCALMTGAALECVHCYSLAHDDLPAMDNDDMRRGRPSLHKAFDEATAILAGDSLLTFAFELLARPQAHPEAGVRIALVLQLARAAGFGGMAGGQMLDLAAEGRFGDVAASADSITQLQRMKTGALLRFACIAGALLGQASAQERDALDRYGQAIGAAFQIADDLLDVEGDAATLGKAVGKDDASGKATLVGLLGRDGARGRLARHVADAHAALASFGERAGILHEAADFIAARRH